MFNRRVLLAVCVLFCVGVFTRGVVVYIEKFEEHLGGEISLRLEETALYTTERIGSVLSETKGRLHDMAVAVAALPSRAERLAYLKQVKRQAGFARLEYMGRDGKRHPIGAPEEGDGPLDSRAEACLSAARAGRDCISDYAGAAGGILLTTPVFPADHDGVEAPGVLAAVLDTAELGDVLKLKSFGDEGSACIVNGDGMVIMRTCVLDVDDIFSAWEKRPFATGYSLDRIREDIAAGRNGMALFSDTAGKRQYVYHSALPFNRWTLITTVSEEAAARNHLHMIQEMIIFGTVMILLFMALAAYCLYSYWASYKARLAAQTKSAFLSSMSHEIRTPLNGIIGLNYLMQRNIDNRDKMRQYLEQSRSTAEYLLSLINDILDINKLDADRMEIASNPLRIDRVVETLQSIFGSGMTAKGIAFTVHADLSQPCILGDAVRLEQVLMNILGNAVKFTPSGGQIRFAVSQRMHDELSVITRFEIVDTGCGMSEDFQERIFEAFSQERNRCTAGNEGTGLGMAISYQLMRKMGGTLSVVSRLGEGSRFTADLPARICRLEDEGADHAGQAADRSDLSDRAEEAARRLPQSGARPAARPGERQDAPSGVEVPMRPLHILVAEDNELNRDLLTEILEMSGMTVQAACDGREALDMFAASEPGGFDVILMDMQMPVMDGLAATRAIRGLERSDAVTVRIYACTANSFAEDREKCLAAGMSGFLAKPVNVPALLEALKDSAAEN